MKKVLFASTALVAGAFAAPQIASAQSVSAGNADISIGGLARWGLGYNEDRAQESILISRFRLNIDAAVELDSGLRFAASIRGEANEINSGALAGNAGPLTFGGGRYQISSGGLRVRFGNISGVFDDGGTIRPFFDNGLEGTIGMVSSFGFPGPAFGNGFDNNGILVNYDVGDFSVAASYVDESQNLGGAEDMQLGFGYAFNGFNFGALIGSTDIGPVSNDYWLLSLDGSFGDFGFAAVVGENDNNGSDEVAYGFGVDYDISAATNISFVYSGGGVADLPGADDAISLGFLHDLGSGTTVRGFIGQNFAGSTIADFGVRFNF